MSAQMERIIALCLLAAVSALATAAALVTTGGEANWFYLVAAVGAGGFVARLRPVR